MRGGPLIRLAGDGGRSAPLATTRTLVTARGTEPSSFGCHRAFASSGQCPQRFSLAAGTRPCWPRLAEDAASGPDRVERVALTDASFPTRPADLEHPLLMTDEKASKTGADRGVALDREHTPAGSVLIGKTKHARVTVTIGNCGRLEHHTASAHVDDRERVRIAMRINADHVVQLICKHP